MIEYGLFHQKEDKVLARVVLFRIPEGCTKSFISLHELASKIVQEYIGAESGSRWYGTFYLGKFYVKKNSESYPILVERFIPTRKVRQL